MIDYTLDTSSGILHLRPKSSLEQADFEQLAKVVDPFIAQNGDLAGIIVETPGFPGWSSFGALFSHMRFVKGHHKHVRKIAIVTDSAIGNIAENLVAHFVSADVKQFASSELDTARQWIKSGS